MQVGYYSDKNAGNAVKELKVSCLQQCSPCHADIRPRGAKVLHRLHAHPAYTATAERKGIQQPCMWDVCVFLKDEVTRRPCVAQELSAPTAVVKRDGDWKTLEVRELVPGDVIELKGGDVVPADAMVGLLYKSLMTSDLSAWCSCEFQQSSQWRAVS